MDKTKIDALKQLESEVKEAQRASDKAQDEFHQSGATFSNTPAGKKLFEVVDKCTDIELRYADACAEIMPEILTELERLQSVEAEYQKHIPFLAVHGVFGPLDFKE